MDSYVHFGRAVNGGGDLDGDGYSDIVVGADNADTDHGLYNTGAVYTYPESASGIDEGGEVKLFASDAVNGDDLGWAVAMAGDINGDGYDDVVAGAVSDNDVGTASGSVYVWLGGAAGISSDTEQEIHASDPATYAKFGISVAGAGDLACDGYADVLVGAHGDDETGVQSGSVYVYNGGSAGLDASTEHKIIAPDGAEYAWFGSSVAALGDVAGDGALSVFVGADLGYPGGSGAAYVFRAKNDGDGDGVATRDDCDDDDSWVDEADDVDTSDPLDTSDDIAAPATKGTGCATGPGAGLLASLLAALGLARRKPD